ncbi:hypothetical protein NUSPORA_02939 [Nucleospora cyclopteri]
MVLCMDLLSRALNGKYPKIIAHSDDGTYACNHLRFVNDLKFLALNDGDFKSLVDETKRFLSVKRLEINKSKSATNSPVCEADVMIIEEPRDTNTWE